MSATEFLGQPLTLIAIAFIAVGAAAIIFLKKGGGTSTGSKKSILVFSPKDKRGREIGVKEEFEKYLDCGKVNGVPIRYYKTGPGWNFPNGVTKFLGLEASAFTAYLVNDKPIPVKLDEALRMIWGPQAYDKMPQQLRDPLEKHRFGVTIIPDPIPIEDKNLKVTAEDRDRENIEVGMEELRKNMKKRGGMDWMTFIQGGCVFGLVVYLLVNFHVLPVVAG